MTITSTAVTQQVADQVKLQYNPAKAHHSGATVPVMIQLLNAAGTNVSATGLIDFLNGLAR